MMYLKRIALHNVGPIAELNYTLPFDASGNPKPLVLVGPNGSGKSIVLSFVVNSLLSAHQAVYDDSEVEKGKVYKFRNPGYVRAGTNFYFADLIFEDDIEVAEWQLLGTRKAIEAIGTARPEHKSWNEIPEDQRSTFWSNVNEKRAVVEKLLTQNSFLYFPANRFEEPGWLNLENLTRRPEFSDAKRISGRSNRTIIQHAPLARNRNWLLDLLFDRNLFDLKTAAIQLNVPTGQQVPATLLVGYQGTATTIDVALNEILRLTLRMPDARLIVGPRHRRDIAVSRGTQPWISNVFQLSTGETAVLNLFMSIIRDYDEAGAAFTSLEDVRGIVVVDEIDAHMHVELQSVVLPQLIKQFPKVQFILTSHSPLFLLGLRRELADDGFVVLALPECEEIGVERFSEFQRAYEALKTTVAHEQEIAAAVAKSHKPAVFVEGDYDIRYLTKAAQLLGREAVLQRVKLLDGEGFGNLNGVWKSLDSKVCHALAHKTILLYDCDVKKNDEDRGKAVRRVIPTIESAPIRKGIENLFPAATIAMVRTASEKFIDVTPEVRKIVRGKEEVIPELLEVNRDEKKNLCNWLCENGTAVDFAGFAAIFDLIESVLAADDE